MHSKGALPAAVVMACGVAAAATAAEFKINDDVTFNAGLGLRTSYSRVDFAAPDGSSKSSDFSVESARIFLGGSYAKVFKGTLNTERSGDDRIHLLDAIAQFEPMPELNVWLGRMLPPSDRANLYGPYFALPWSFPGVASAYPAIFAGRDNGVMLWGKPMAGKLVYSLGAFEGHNKLPGLSGQSDKPLFAGRLAYNFWEPEPAPAHYTGGWYGGKDLLTIGLAAQSQKDGVGTATAAGKFSAWSIDLLLEKRLAAGVPTFEAAYYKYKLGALDCGSGEPGSPACVGTGDNVGGLVDGKAVLLGAAWLVPAKAGQGQFQPFVRWQRFERSASRTSAKELDVGVNYLIRGPNARLTAQLGRLKDERVAAPRDSVAIFTLGAQLMF